MSLPCTPPIHDRGSERLEGWSQKNFEAGGGSSFPSLRGGEQNPWLGGGGVGGANFTLGRDQ